VRQAGGPPFSSLSGTLSIITSTSCLELSGTCYIPRSWARRRPPKPTQSDDLVGIGDVARLAMPNSMHRLIFSFTRPLILGHSYRIRAIIPRKDSRIPRRTGAADFFGGGKSSTTNDTAGPSSCASRVDTRLSNRSNVKRAIALESFRFTVGQPSAPRAPVLPPVFDLVVRFMPLVRPHGSIPCARR